MSSSEKRFNVVATLQVEGLHQWKGCDIQEVAFLRNYHRHIFHITCKRHVSHTDREVEVISLKREVLKYLHDTFDNKNGAVSFGTRSCEEIAANIAGRFGLCYCSVMEDGENGAEYVTD